MSLAFSKLKQLDWPLFVLMVLMVCFGLILQSGLSLSVARPGLSSFERQLIFVLLGLFLFFLISLSDYRLIRSLSYPFYVLVLFLLLAVLFFGTPQRGVKGWFSLGTFNFQPIELAKLSVIILLARFWQTVRRPLKFRHLFLSFMLILPLLVLTIFQPDIGSAIVVFIIGLGLSLMADRNKKHILILFIILIIIFSSSWFFLKDYQKDRFLNYFNPSQDPFGRGYQLNQAIIAVGSGGFFGRGFGLGTQSYLKFLPGAETDFTFAVLAEEFGFTGCLLFLGFYLFFLLRLIKISKKIYDNFALVLVLGVALYFFSQMFINVGMNLGLLPIIGLPLPFLSYGGSSLLVSMIAVALVESVIIHQPPHQISKLSIDNF